MEDEWIDDLPVTRNRMVGLAVAVEGGMGVGAWIAGMLLGLPVAGWVLWSWRGVLWGLGAAVMMLGLLGLSRAVPVGPLGKLNRLVDRLVQSLFGNCRWWELLLIAIVAGWGEELLFRGVIQGGLEGWMSARFADGPGWLPGTVALGVASVLFGFAHCLSREYVVFAIILGALLGGLALHTGDLLAPIVAHAVYDFVALMVLRRSWGGRGGSRIPGANARKKFAD